MKLKEAAKIIKPGDVIWSNADGTTETYKNRYFKATVKSMCNYDLFKEKVTSLYCMREDKEEGMGADGSWCIVCSDASKAHIYFSDPIENGVVTP